MKTLNQFKRPVALLMLCLLLSLVSFQNSIAFGAVSETSTLQNNQEDLQAAAVPAAIAAGVVLVAGAVKASYDAGYVAGRAAYQLFGDSELQSTFAYANLEYSPTDFSSFDN